MSDLNSKKDMKKIACVLTFLLALSFILCTVIGFCKKVPMEVSKNAVFSYKFLDGLELFIEYIPVLMISWYVVAFSVHFGNNCAGSMSRFSKAMAERFKNVMILTIAITFVLTMSVEVFGNLINRRKSEIINRPRIINEYVKVGNRLYENGFYERAKRYADAALKLEPNLKSAVDLIDRCEEEIQQSENKNVRVKIYEAVEEAEKVDRVVINPQQIKEVYSYYRLAKDAFDKKQWFNAHYYAETGIGLATAKDPNLEELKKISNSAWNNLSECHNLEKNSEQQDFDKKYEGYLALVQKDDLKAYYIFRELYLSSKKMHSDPDVKFYLDIAEKKVNERSFFIDETFELASFESANDIYFACNYKDGTKDIVYFKGMTCVEETGNSIQYLRDLTVTTIDKDGNLYRTMHVPYAKVLPVSVKNLPLATKRLVGLDKNVDFIPYLMLKSIERDRPDSEVFPEYVFADGEESVSPDYMLLSMPYEHFLMLENLNTDISSISITKLLKFARLADKYGYIPQTFIQVFMDRIFYPFFIMILFIMLATFAWHNRIKNEQYFKFIWILLFPEYLIVAFVFYRLSIFIFRLTDFTLTGCFGLVKGMIAGSVLYVVALFFMSVKFLSCRTRS